MKTSPNHAQSTQQLPEQVMALRADAPLTAWLTALDQRISTFGIETLTMVWQQLRPAAVTTPIITVGGTNGKGSTTAFLEAIYQQAGYRTGVTRSPHLLVFNERIRVNGNMVNDASITAAFAHIRDVTASMGVALTYFEFAICAAMLIFTERQPVDVIILEVGLGGRLDATNVFDADVAVLTTIGLDHMRLLGATREAIGDEKVRICRRGAPAIIGERALPATVSGYCHEHGVPMQCLDEAFSYTRGNGEWRWYNQHTHYTLPPPALRGDHQFDNAACAIAAVTALQQRLPVDAAAIATGIATAHIDGRCQRLYYRGKTVYCDVGHNSHGARALAQTIRSLHAAPVALVLRLLQDKDIDDYIAAVAPITAHWHLPAAGQPRDCGNDVLSQRIVALQREAVVTLHDSVFAAIDAAAASDTVLVCGSFCLIETALPYLLHDGRTQRQTGTE